MAEAIAVKKLGKFEPFDDTEAEIFAAVPDGTVVRIKWSRVRNYKFLKLYWAMIGKIVENTGYPTKESLHKEVCEGIGHGETVATPRKVYFEPWSISFAKMDEDEFRIYWNKSVDWIIAHVLPVEKADLEREVFLMVGFDLWTLKE